MSGADFAAFGIDPRGPRRAAKRGGALRTPPVHPPCTPCAYEMPGFVVFGADPRGPCRAAIRGALPPAACGVAPRDIFGTMKEALR